MDSLKRTIDAACELCQCNKADLARALGISRQRLCDYESGRRPMPAHTLASLAVLAHISSVYALGEYQAERVAELLRHARNLQK